MIVDSSTLIQQKVSHKSLPQCYTATVTITRVNMYVTLAFVVAVGLLTTLTLFLVVDAASWDLLPLG